ncbi:MAG TPA: hypothetical protein VGS19_14860 [Streptosporangiaceae bacterium]|nr:hypothetical protein [Streptosporangiaceae bacterium]
MADVDHGTLDISSADELIRYAVRAQLALVSETASHNAIAKAIGMARDHGTSTAGARLSHALADGSFSDGQLQKLDEVVVTLAPATTTHAGGLGSLAVCLRGLRDRESLSGRVPAGWAQEILQSPADDEVAVLTQASALLSAFLAADEIEKASRRSRAVRVVQDRYSKEVVHVVYQLITLGYAPPTPRSVEALIMLGTLGSYALDTIKRALDYALPQPLGFRIWRVITTLVMLGRRQQYAQDLRLWVKQVLTDAEELRGRSLYPGRSLDLELAIRVPRDWSPSENDWAGAVLLARANNPRATIRERGTAAMGLWQRAVAGAYTNQVAASLNPLIEEFENPGSRPDASPGMRWVATTLRYVIDQGSGVCNDWPQANEPWMQHVYAAVSYLDRQVIPDDVRSGTKALFQHSLLQNAGIYRRQAIEALVAGGWTGPVARALERFLELETESWIRIRALFALGFLQHRDRGVEKTLAAACHHAYSNFSNDPTPAQITEMHSALFAVGDCYGAAGLEESDVRRVRESIREVLAGLVLGERTLRDSLFPVSRACAYLLTFMILPRSDQHEDLAEGLLKELVRHPDRTTRELSSWALANRVDGEGAVKPLVRARV